jgi:RHH-type transcriptional regulator, proline utilization regulon repressor / proline dehydrogenase / delta 1-pyrroline-5-carboxylate dehydrogenase
LLKQLAACFSCDNNVLLPAPFAALLPPDLPVAVSDMITTVEQAALAQAELPLALIDASLAAAWLPLLAARDGALVPVVETVATDPISLWRLVAERAVCVNTAAAGGNASLMMLNGQEDGSSCAPS